MATPDTKTADQLESAAQSLDSVSAKLSDVTGKLNDLFGRLAKEGAQSLTAAGDTAGELSDGLERGNKNAGALKNSLDGIAGAASSMTNLQSMVKSVQGSLGNMAKTAHKDLGAFEQNASRVKDALKAVGAIGLAKIKLDLLDRPELKPFKDVSAELASIREAALQTGMGVGKTFESASDNVNKFSRSLVDTMGITYQTREDVLSINKALGQAFGDTGPTTNINKLSQASNAMQGQLNLVNTAFMVSAATGMNASSVADMLGEAHLTLGESIEESALSLGRMAQSSRSSGLHFSTVSKAMLDGATSLRMFGATTASVQPVFEAFSKSLSGVGRQGLTPDLFKSFISGLQGMQFEYKALLGLQSPQMAGKGALGAGLEMEMALEDKTGAGMKKIVDTLSSTLQQFGGGRIVTREEAAKDPGLERAFMIQRQLLGQMMGMDAGTANKTLDMLKGIETTGLQVGSDQEAALAELVGSGKATIDQTKTEWEKASKSFEASTLKGSQMVVEAINNLGATTPAGAMLKVVGNVSAAIDNISKKGGQTDIKSVMSDLKKGLTPDQIKDLPFIEKIAKSIIGNTKSTDKATGDIDTKTKSAREKVDKESGRTRVEKQDTSATITDTQIETVKNEENVKNVVNEQQASPVNVSVDVPGSLTDKNVEALNNAINNVNKVPAAEAVQQGVSKQPIDTKPLTINVNETIEPRTAIDSMRSPMQRPVELAPSTKSTFPTIQTVGAAQQIQQQKNEAAQPTAAQQTVAQTKVQQIPIEVLVKLKLDGSSIKLDDSSMINRIKTSVDGSI